MGAQVRAGRGGGILKNHKKILNKVPILNYQKETSSLVTTKPSKKKGRHQKPTAMKHCSVGKTKKKINSFPISNGTKFFTRYSGGGGIASLLIGGGGGRSALASEISYKKERLMQARNIFFFC